MGSQLKRVESGGKREMDEHPGFKAFLTKLGKDNIGMLAGFLSWSILTSIVPIVVGLVAISSLFLRSPSAQHEVVTHLSQALQNVFSPSELQSIVSSSVKHSGILGLIGFLGVLWGGSNVGGAFSTAFQAIYETQGRSFIKEKLLDIGMIFVFTVLMLVILAATAAGSILSRLFSGFPLPGVAQFVIGTGISLLAAFLLFGSIYIAFPNIETRFKWKDVWPGALLAAVLFEVITYVWPLYAHFSHFNRYGAIFVPLLVLTAWIYFFSMIALLGAELSAVLAIRKAKSQGQSVGPPPTDSVPQHDVLREQQPRGKAGAATSADRTEPAGQRSSTRTTSGATHGTNDGRPRSVGYAEVSDRTVERDPKFWLLSAVPIVVGALAGAYELGRGGTHAR